jgi:RimK-like ATP-grasp domain
MIVLAGIPSEPALERVADELTGLGAPFVWFDQRRAAVSGCSFRIDDDGLCGTLRDGDRSVPLEDVVGVYWRLMDDRLLPELKGLAADAPERARCRQLHDAFSMWLSITPARVLNRAAAMASNGSKPYQAQLIRAAGFDVPETLVTNDPDLVRAFVAQHGRVVYKSASGTRSIVEEVDTAALERLDDVRWCPVQFQGYVEGVDVRVHVVGEEVFATRVASDAADYRYAAARGGPPARLEATRLSGAVEARCVALTERLGLRFSGIDLRITPDDRVVCFEANPSPAYSYYESHTGQPIARAVVRHLAGTAA